MEQQLRIRPRHVSLLRPSGARPEIIEFHGFRAIRRSTRGYSPTPLRGAGKGIPPVASADVGKGASSTGTNDL